MRKGHRRHKQLLKSWFSCRFDFCYTAHSFFHLVSQFSRQKRLNCACTRSIANRSNTSNWTIRYETENHCVNRINVRTKRTRKTNVVRTRIPVWVLEQARRLGTNESDLLRAYPTLRADDLANAWAYVRSHAEEITAQIRANEEE